MSATQNSINQIVYGSRMSRSFKESDVPSILEKSRTNNQRKKASGVLLVRGCYFLQLLEGDRFDVSYTFKKVRDDRRHGKVHIVMEQTSQHRLFEQCGSAAKLVYSAASVSPSPPP